MGTVHNPVTGALELDAVHVSLWSGFTYVGQVVGMLSKLKMINLVD